MSFLDFLDPQKEQGNKPLSQLKDKWTNWAKSSEGKSALIQMGVNLMQPIAPGQSTFGHVGQAIGAGQEARDRSIALEQETADKKARRQLEESKLQLSQQELEQMGPVRAAQAANYHRLATQPPGGGGSATWGPQSRLQQTLINAYGRLDPLVEEVPDFDTFVRGFGVDPDKMREDAELERLAWHARQGGGQPQGQPQLQPQGQGQPQVQGQGQGQPQPQTQAQPQRPQPTMSSAQALQSPRGSQAANIILQRLRSQNPAENLSARQAIEALKAAVTDPKEIERFFDRELRKRGLGGATAR